MSLSSLIVQREVATIRQVEEALSRQVLYGGDLVTNVLEVAQVDEATLMPLLAESSHMPHAPLGSLPAPSPAAIALVPVDLAVRRLLYPLTVSGDTLVVAVAEPLDADVATELSFALGVLIEQRIAPLVRIREGHAAAYGAPLDRRMQRLVARLGGSESVPSGSLPPLLSRGPANAFQRLSSEPPAPASDGPTAWHDPPKSSGRYRPKHPTSSGFPAPVLPSPLPSQDEPPDTDKADEPPPPTPVVPEPPAVVALPIVQVGEPAPKPIEPPLAQWVAPRRSSAPPRPSVLVRLVHHEAAPQAARRRRGPLTLERAKVELDQASERDALLELLFAFSLQFFEYSALFIVHGDIAEGRDAYGPGATRDRVLGIGVPLELPSAISEARDRAAPVIARPVKGGLDAVLAQDLGRSPDAPILVVPVVVRARTVAVFYGDNGDHGVDGQGSGEVTAFASRVGQAFERIIVRRKLGGFAADAPTALPRVDPGRVSSAFERKSAVTREAPAVLQKALSEEGLVRPPSVRPPPPARARTPPPPPALALDLTPGPPLPVVPAPPLTPVVAVASAAAVALPPAVPTAPLPPSAVETAPELPPTPTPAPPPPHAEPTPEPDEATEIDEIEEVEEVEATAIDDEEPTDEPGRDSGDNFVLALANRRTIRVAPLFPDAPEESPAPGVAQEFADLPPPPQAAAVRKLSDRPIPREEPDPGTIDLPAPAPLPREDVGGVVAAGTEMTDEEAARLMEDLEKTNPEPRSAFFPPDASSGGVSVSSIIIPKAPPSQAVAVSAHKPPTAQARSHELPSVIIDVSTEFLALVDKLAADPSDDIVEAELLRQGQRAMPSIMARFPGPITMSLTEIEEKRARVGDCGPILKLIAGQRRVALPFVLARLEDKDADARFWSTFLLTELAYPEAVPGVVARLFDDEERTRRVARLAAKVVGETAREALLEELDRMARDPAASVDKRIKTMDALGEMRDSIVVPVLIGGLGDDHEEVAVAARRALTLVSRQDFGKDARRWLAWWASSSARHRIEWLIDALTHDHAAMRKSAAQELKTITREYFGYYDDLPKRERERAQQRYRDWWQSEGRAKFRRS